MVFESLFEIYLLNLLLTLAMFLVLTFRAWIEFKNFKLMWRELEWRRTREAVAKLLEEERGLFEGSRDGEELYRILCRIFEVESREDGG